MSTQQDTFNRLKYPDSHTWRDKSTIRNGYWPNGDIARISDPEFRFDLDRLSKDPSFIAKTLKSLKRS